MTVTRGIELTGRGGGGSKNTVSMVEKHWGRTRTVLVHREHPSKSIGISIVGGKIDVIDAGGNISPETLTGIFVKHVMPNSAAYNTGQFKAGDRILEVSGVSLRHADHSKAVEAIKNAKSPITFVVQSLVPWGSKESETIQDTSNDLNSNILATIHEINQIAEEQDAHVSSNHLGEYSGEVEDRPMCRTPEPGEKNEIIKKYESSDESEEDEDVFDLEGKTTTKAGYEIDRASAGFIKRNKEEIALDTEEEDEFGYTTNKVRKKYSSLEGGASGGGNVVMVQLERGAGGGGLGISLAGHRDRNCMAVFVCGLNPRGAAAKQGALQVGDEILEVNGIVLHGRCHLNASAIIKGLSGPIFKVIILRRKTAVEDLAVRPITHFPVNLAEETPEEKYANYPNVRIVTIKKGTQSLGVMIIEGRHAEVGQGIFISDIQEGSQAEKAGLDIGEMILAVNDDTLLGASYDTAAGILKRSEGVITLVVSNLKRMSPVPSLEVSHAYDEACDAVNDGRLTPGGVSSGRKTPGVDGRETPKDGLKVDSRGGSRPTTPINNEPHHDPAKDPIHVGRETVIEITTDNKPLGLSFVGGKDTHISKGIVVLEVYPEGAADRDGRLQPGDQIVDVNGTSLIDVTNYQASMVIRQQLSKFKMHVYRAASVEMSTVSVDITKKPGKGIGLSVMAKKRGNGVFVSEILNGSSADVDGQLMKGDLIIQVNDTSVEKMSAEEVAALLKTTLGKVQLKLFRHKPTYSR